MGKKGKSKAQKRSRAKDVPVAPPQEPSDDGNDEDVEIPEEDAEFVSSLTPAQLEFFMKRLNPNSISITPKEQADIDGVRFSDEEEDDEEEGEEGADRKPSKEKKPKKEVVAESESDDEVDEAGFDKMREPPKSWVAEEVGRSLLPVKSKTGAFVAPKLTEEEIQEQLELDKKRAERDRLGKLALTDKTTRKRRKPGDVLAEEAEAAAAESKKKDVKNLKMSELDELREFQEQLENEPDKRTEIETLATGIIANPEAGLGKNMTRLMTLCVDEDPVVKQLALLSVAAVLSDLIPSYRVREDNEEKQGNVLLSKEVKQLRRYERSFLHCYRVFCDLVRSILALRQPNPPTAEEHAKYERGVARRFHVNNIKVLHRLQVVAVKGLKKLLLSNASFNGADGLWSLMVESSCRMDVAGGEFAAVCVDAVVSLFEQRMELEQILYVVTEIGRVFKARKFQGNAELLRAFLKLEISDAITDVDIKTAFDRGVRKKKEYVSKKKKKQSKFQKQVDEKVREAEAERRKSEVLKFQRRMAEAMFLTYFRIIKTAQKSSLLPAVLEGVARWCHLLNVDFMFEIIQALLKMLQSANLPLEGAFHCAITAFQALRNAGDVFRIDLSAYFKYIYPKLLHLPFAEDAPQGIGTGETIFSVALRCLDLMLASKMYRISVRSAAFAKRITTIALQTPTNASIALLELCQRILSTDSRLQQLIDPEEVGTADVFQPEVDDPDNCHPFSTCMYELLMMQEHYHPHVSLFSRKMTQMETMVAHDPGDYLYSYDLATQVFNPSVKEPPALWQDKKLRKISKYDPEKQEKFMKSLIPRPPESKSEFCLMSEELAKSLKK